MLKNSAPSIFIWLLVVASAGFFSCENTQPKDEPTTNNTANVPELEALNQSVQNDPDNPEPYVERARYYYRNNALDLAEMDLQRALEIDSTQAEVMHLLADTYMDNFQSRKALKTLEAAVELYPKRIPTLLKLAEFQLILKQYDDALASINKVIAIDPQESEAYFMTGMVMREKGDEARAINAFQRTTELNPDNADAWIILGNLFDERGNPIAEQYFDNALRVDPENPYALHAKAFYLQNNGDVPGAIQLYKSINRSFPKYVDAYLNTGILYLTMDSLDQAWEHFNIAIANAPTDARSYYFRGLIAEQRGEYDNAKKDYEQALRLQPDYKEAKEALELLEVQ